MSRRTMLVAAALLVLVCARMPAWREAGALTRAPAQASPSGEPAQDQGGANAAWAWAPALRRQLGLILVREGS